MNKHADAILLVEDNPDDAELTRLALARHGLDGRVTHVSDGIQALDYLYRRDAFADRTGGNPVLVLLDLKMPLLDGIGVLREIKGSDSLRNIPVVVLTSSTEPSDLQRAYDAGTLAAIIAGARIRRSRPWPPASTRQTVTDGSSDSRAARTQPALPPPAMM
jgi:CheY-like chemotaxis protein